MSSSCSNMQCDGVTVDITEWGTNSGDFITGHYEGDMEFLEDNQQTVTHFVEADFRYQVD